MQHELITIPLKKFDKLLLNEEQHQHVKMNFFKDGIHPTDFDVMNDDKIYLPMTMSSMWPTVVSNLASARLDLMKNNDNENPIAIILN